MKLVLNFLLLSWVMLIVFSFSYRSEHTKPVAVAIEFFKTQSKVFAKSASTLEAQVKLIDNRKLETIVNAKEALKNCRLEYKKIEFFLTYFFTEASMVYNAPAKFEVEEPNMEYREPVGLQVVEGLLYEKDVEAHKNELLQQLEVLVTSAHDLNSLLYNLKANEKQLLESIRLELIRIIALNISGYDAPMLKTGISESFVSLSSIAICLKSYSQIQQDSVSYYLTSSINFLKTGTDFDSFDRLAFITECALPLQKHLSRFISNDNLQLSSTAALNYDADNLFSANAIDLSSFPGAAISNKADVVELGEQLFSEKLLSGNNKRTCISCHQPENYFADGIAKSIAFDERSTVERNAPSLLYAAFQYSQFWDGRVKSLEEQVKQVIENPVEMNADHSTVVKRLQDNLEYKKLFRKAFSSEQGSSISIDNIVVSIAAYIRTLNPLNSAFDRYIAGDRTALTQQQMNGFNLFMGKGQCGTCHFAPLFNGLIPPLYKRTEVEVLGTPATDNFTSLQADRDSGRFRVFPSKFYVGAFKTPTVRNAAVTSPYMHNGGFHTLESVVDFYNKGGGAGLGLKVETQTLPPTPLNLSNKEVTEIVSFLSALTDSLNTLYDAIGKSK